LILFFQINDDDEVNEGNDASFYQRVNEMMPELSKTRIVGDTDTQMKEQEEFRSNDDKNNRESEMGVEEEGGGQALNFKESPMEFEDDEEEVVEDEQLEKGVKMIKMEDGSTKMVFSGDQKDIVEKMRKLFRDKLVKSKENETRAPCAEGQHLE